MSFLNNISVKAKLLVGFLSVLVIFGIVSLISIVYINATNAAIERINFVVAQRMDVIADLQNSAMEGDFAFADILTNFQDTSVARQNYIKILDTQADLMDGFKNKMQISGPNAKKMQEVANNTTVWIRVYRSEMRNALLSGTFEQINNIYGTGLAAPYKALANGCNELNEIYRDEAIKSTAALVKDKSMYYIVFGTILAVVCSLLIAFSFANMVVKRLRECIDSANRIAKGDLSLNIYATTRDEFGVLISAFSAMQDNLNHSISSIMHRTNAVVEKVKNIQNLNHRIAEDIAVNDTNAVTVASAVSEMVSTTSNIAASCEGAASSSGHSRDATEQGMQSVKHAIEMVKLQSERTHEDAKNLESLSQQTQKIGFIVNTIDDIANQTNLLALNAAIEAARAGEVGRGFAVVADEVRALASRTTNSTSEIKSMVQSIQDSAKHSVDSMSRSVENIGELADAAGLLENVFDDVISNVELVNTQVTQISAAAEEQNAATNEISKNIHSISDSSHKVANLAENGLQELDEMVDNLVAIQQSMQNFKLADAYSRSQLDAPISAAGQSFVNAETNVYPAASAARSFEPAQGSQGSQGYASGAPAYATADQDY